MGVGVYVFAVFRGSGLGTAWPVGSGFMCSLSFVGADSVRHGPWGSGFMCWLCFVGADSVWRGSRFMYLLCFVGAAWQVGVGVYAFAVFRGSIVTRGAGVHVLAAVRGSGPVFAVFLGNGLGTAWAVGDYVLVVFCGNVLGTAWPVRVRVYVFNVFMWGFFSV